MGSSAETHCIVLCFYTRTQCTICYNNNKTVNRRKSIGIYRVVQKFKKPSDKLLTFLDNHVRHAS